MPRIERKTVYVPGYIFFIFLVSVVAGVRPALNLSSAIFFMNIHFQELEHLPTRRRHFLHFAVSFLPSFHRSIDRCWRKTIFAFIALAPFSLSLSPSLSPSLPHVRTDDTDDRQTQIVCNYRLNWFCLFSPPFLIRGRISYTYTRGEH